MESLNDEMSADGRVEDALALARETSDPHTKTFSLLAVAKSKMSQKKLGEMRDLLMEAAPTEEKEEEPDLKAAACYSLRVASDSIGFAPYGE
jgi:hypothetical protein